MRKRALNGRRVTKKGFSNVKFVNTTTISHLSYQNKFLSCCLLCRVAALMLLNNALNKSDARLSLLCEMYIWGQAKAYLKHLFDVLWEAYLHTEEALCKARAWSAWFLSDFSYRPQRNCARRFYTVRKSGHYTASIKFPENFQMYLCCSCLAAVVCYHCSAKGQVLDFGKRTKSTVGNLTFKSKKCFFFF